jgi:hypothetical protein
VENSACMIATIKMTPPYARLKFRTKEIFVNISLNSITYR